MYIPLIIVIFILFAILSSIRFVYPNRESFVGDIAPMERQLLGGQGELSDIHTTDIHSRIPTVRLSDPTSRWSQSY